MTELPSGTVTFLFTDLEGSTRLLKELGKDSYDEVLGEHRRLLQAAFAAHEGKVVDTQGDSFFVAFRTAADAVAAAVDAQRDLAAARWPEGVAVRVRMGLHTGEPKVGDERYVGIGVHRAARIGACGHGGQVLLSSTTKELAEEELPPGVSIRDLGERRLKDLDQPQRLYQLDVDGLPSKFAELNTLDVALRRRKRRMYAGSALIGVIAAAVAIPVFAFAQGGSDGGIVTHGNAVAEIDPGSNRVVGQVPNVGARPASIAYGSGSLWVANLDDQTVARIDPDSLSVIRNVPTKATPTSLATTPGAVWVVNANAGRPSVTVEQIDPQFNSAAETRTLGNVVVGGPGYVASRGNDVWVAPPRSPSARTQPGSRTATRTRSSGSTRPACSRPSASATGRARSPSEPARSGWRTRSPGPSRESIPSRGPSPRRFRPAGSRAELPSATGRSGSRTAATALSPASIPSTTRPGRSPSAAARAASSSRRTASGSLSTNARSPARRTQVGQRA